MKTEKEIKIKKRDVNKELKAKKDKMLAHNKELKKKGRSKTKKERDAKEKFTKKSKAMKIKEEQVAASMSLIRKIGVQSVQLTTVKKKIDAAELELKYRYDNKRLKKEKKKLDKTIEKQKKKRMLAGQRITSKTSESLKSIDTSWALADRCERLLNYKTVTRMLIEAKCDLNARDDQGFTSLDFCFHFGTYAFDILHMLTFYGATHSLFYAAYFDKPQLLAKLL